jgi:hypothetical protein
MMLMTTARDENVPVSSIVMKAIDAKTFTELQAFVKDLESRPTERLLRDLPDLVRLPLSGRRSARACRRRPTACRMAKNAHVCRASWREFGDWRFKSVSRF